MILSNSGFKGFAKMTRMIATRITKSMVKKSQMSSTRVDRRENHLSLRRRKRRRVPKACQKVRQKVMLLLSLLKKSQTSHLLQQHCKRTPCSANYNYSTVGVRLPLTLVLKRGLAKKSMLKRSVAGTEE